jgi:hypothetical protein
MLGKKRLLWVVVLFFVIAVTVQGVDSDSSRVQDACTCSTAVLHHGHVLKCDPRSWRTKTDLSPQEATG